jgi:hypothetical protein
MGHLSWLSEAPIRRIAPCSPQSHGMPRVDDRHVISGIIFVIKEEACAGGIGRGTAACPR